MEALEDESDEDLVVRIAHADHRAFTILVTRHTDMFYASAYRMTGNRIESEDVVQDAFLKLWNRADNFDAGKGVKFTTWFYRVVTNLAIDRMRKNKKQVAADFLEDWADDTYNAQNILENSEEQAYLEAAIQALPDKQKAALNLCFYEGLSNKEAADILGVGVKALESLLMRAKTGIKDTLARQGKLA